MLCIILSFFALIIFFTKFSIPSIKLLSLVFVNVFCIEIGLLIAIIKEKSVDKFLAAGMLWAFLIIFIIVLIVVSEGEVLSGIGDFSFSLGGKKKKK